ncbi:hypothetical protein [Ancylobacter vacuolatus]|uniref:Uncharacterized protein n=1 Tax=Ancylobacter vacuolatus TaxID=223389 RepID=A0ABU0DNK9_9HYPH|nr:hypothetical protein [Ancylobacter vacuolatus]MDQ0350047.1 hypothetical protein [Ancylobacter vacuolatus]
MPTILLNVLIDTIALATFQRPPHRRVNHGRDETGFCREDVGARVAAPAPRPSRRVWTLGALARLGLAR